MVTVCAGGFQPRNLAVAHTGVVDVADVDWIFFVFAIFVHADDDFGAPVDVGLPLSCRLFNPQLGHARGDCLGHAAQFFDLFHQRPCGCRQIVGQLLDIVAARQRIDDMSDASFLLQDQLSVAGDARGKVGRQGDGFVQRVGM